MIFEKINLTDDGKSFLTVYCSDEKWTRRDAMLVIPGGGYSVVCSDREGEPIALNYLANGVNAFVLNYSVGKESVFPTPLIQASLAVAYIRKNADRYNIDPERIFCVGFSAGGHLAASLGTLWDSECIYNKTDLKFGDNKVRGMVLGYPVISAFNHPHLGSFYNILGTTSPNDEQKTLYSAELNVSEKTVPAFIFHSSDDDGVPVQNSLCFASALAEQKIRFELHIYPSAGHGCALATWQTSRGYKGHENEQMARWLTDSIKWMQTV